MVVNREAATPICEIKEGYKAPEVGWRSHRITNTDQKRLSVIASSDDELGPL